MPFTIAHPAAAVPLARPLGRLGVLSALVIGSVTPDLPYFLPLPVSRAESHSLAGLVWFCLPGGLAVYGLFHLALKRPLSALLPAPVQGRLHTLLDDGEGRRPAPWSALVVSIVLGASTHVAWDSFTHAGAPGIHAFPLLGRLLFTVGGYEVFVFKALQHASTLAGSLLLAWWIVRWYRGTAVDPIAPSPLLAPRARLVLVGALVVVACAAAALASADVFPARLRLRAFQRYTGVAVVGGLSGLSAAVAVYCVAFHAWRAVRTRRSAR